ncbi:hypothetical protein Ciccas_010613 [Cichlidogyrus casuarinus]|uniref:Ig-like domain-containing protein n=1 Tax=Cichlidogyrus casuarinus TaxID=1844966 RepID=A0ABD2PTM6_9PLAT
MGFFSSRLLLLMLLFPFLTVAIIFEQNLHVNDFLSTPTIFRCFLKYAQPGDLVYINIQTPTSTYSHPIKSLTFTTNTSHLGYQIDPELVTESVSSEHSHLFALKVSCLVERINGTNKKLVTRNSLTISTQRTATSIIFSFHNRISVDLWLDHEKTHRLFGQHRQSFHIRCPLCQDGESRTFWLREGGFHLAHEHSCDITIRSLQKGDFGSYFCSLDSKLLMAAHLFLREIHSKRGNEELRVVQAKQIPGQVGMFSCPHNDSDTHMWETDTDVLNLLNADEIQGDYKKPPKCWIWTKTLRKPQNFRRSKRSTKSKV